VLILQGQVFWFVTTCRFVVGYQSSLHPEDGGSMGLRNVGIIPQLYMASQARRPGLNLHSRYGESLKSFTGLHSPHSRASSNVKSCSSVSQWWQRAYSENLLSFRNTALGTISWPFLFSASVPPGKRFTNRPRQFC